MPTKMPNIEKGADANARDQVPEFLQTPVFHQYRPGVLLHNWWMGDARKNVPWCLRREAGDMCTMNNIFFQNPGMDTVDLCSRRYNKYKNGHGTCCVFPRDPTGADKELDLVSDYDEYHNQRLICERKWPLRRDYNAKQKAFIPNKFYPPIRKPPTNWGVVQSKQAEWEEQKNDANPYRTDYTSTYQGHYLDRFIPPPRDVLHRECLERVNQIPPSAYEADCVSTTGGRQSRSFAKIMEPCQPRSGEDCAYTHRDFRRDMANCTDAEKPKAMPATCVAGPLHPHCDPCQGGIFRKPEYNTESQLITILPLMGPGEEKPGPRTFFHVEDEKRTIYPPLPKRLPDHICARCDQ